MVSLAKSASSMTPLAVDRLAEMLVRLFTVCDRRLEIAPSSDRWMLTVWIALSMALIAAIALKGLSRVGPDDELVEELLDEAVENMSACTSEEVSVPEEDSHAGILQYPIISGLAKRT